MTRLARWKEKYNKRLKEIRAEIASWPAWKREAAFGVKKGKP